jgi:hypothetical protein
MCENHNSITTLEKKIKEWVIHFENMKDIYQDAMECTVQVL